jgi:hypothetical protein
MWSLLIFFIVFALGIAAVVRGARGGQRERKQLIQAIIFLVGIFLFLVALTPKFFPNRYDSGHVSGPAVVETADGYRMYFTGHTLSVNLGREGAASIGIADSRDGVTWAKRDGGPVLTRSLARFTDSYGVAEPAIVRKGDTWYMYYIGTSYTGATTIDLATSSDGLAWRKSGANPIVEPQRPLPALDEVEAWSDEQVADFLASRGYEDDFFKVGKRTWLTDVLSISQRPGDPSLKNAYLEAKRAAAKAGRVEKPRLVSKRDALRTRWRGDPGFFPNVRIKSLAVAQYVLAPGKVADRFVIDPALSISTSDVRAAKATVDALFKAKGVEQPDWAAVSVMPEDEVDRIVKALGVPDAAFAIPKRQYLLTALNILGDKLGWADALRFLKVTGDAGANATHLDFYNVYRTLKKKLTHGIDGDGFADLSVVYDEAANEFRMWYVAKGFKGNVLAYATSTDGVKWTRASWTESEALRALGAINAVSVIPDAGGYRAAVVRDGTIGLVRSPAGVIGWTVDRADVLSTGERGAFDSKAIVSVALHKRDGGYFIWYAAESRDADRPLPTLDQLNAMSNKQLFRYADIVGCRMSWDRDDCRKFVSYARDFVEKRSRYLEIGLKPFKRTLRVPAWDFEASIELALKPLTLMVAPGAIYGYDDGLVRQMALRYKIELEVKDPEHLAEIDRDDVIWWIRKTLLSRCLVKYGRSLEYPSLDEIDAYDFDELVEACRRYGVQGIPPLPDPGQQLSDEERRQLAEPLREGLRTFSKLCKGKKAFLDSLSDEDVVRIATQYSVGVILGRTRHTLKRNLGRLDPNLLRAQIEKDVQKRFDNWLEKQPLVTRIGLARSTDGETWTKVEGPEALGSVLDARGRFEKARNPLQAAVEAKLADYVVLLGWMAVFLGTINLFRHHGRVVLRLRENWFFSAMFFISFFFMLVCSAIFWPRASTFVRVPDPVHFADNFIANPLIATILALLGYYITSAAYRAFRIKNVEATVMMLVAVFVMLGNVPAFEPITRNTLLHTVFDQLHFPLWRDWIMNKGNAAVFRALNFGLAIGVVAMSIRIIFGIERGAFFEKL